MIVFVAMYLAFTSPPSDREIDSLQKMSGGMSWEAATSHLVASRAAGIVHGVRPELLLAIAHHESRYQVTARTPEPGHRVSCGVMTPVPKQRCSAEDFQILNGYDTGAEHYRMWLDHCRGNEICALLSYAGGSGLVRVCARFGKWRTPRGSNACDFAYQIRRRANQLHQVLL